MKTNNDPPSWLDREGKAYWRRVAPVLQERGVLNPLTEDLLSCAAQAYSTYREAQKKLREEGRVITSKTGAVKVSPWLTVEKQAFETMARVFKELQATEAQPSADDLDKFIEGNE